MEPILDRTRERDEAAHAFVRAYQPYQWPVDTVTDVKVAPFQVLAGEGRTFLDRDHGWHLAIADRLAAADPDVIQTTGGSGRRHRRDVAGRRDRLVDGADVGWG